ncbi:TetR family transcriptional regulator [Nocardia sp. ET3-3]|uniref:TetR family transcriptional regulator n=1 Tax=Nocardia terrae TaxID=2675851 RepID=A0A7K1V255_9NOCA|nr:TetR family transcriptional regulator [Nocardia terrae]MVU80720.1 TetR family transcriptional regulator [Nocardia terrae]
MPRPARPLLDRSLVIKAAIEIIDSEGLAACSMPRLARVLGVKAPSLYYHFDDRADIMAEVSRAIVAETVMPRKRDANDWIEWFVVQAVSFRRAVLRHPNAAPILLEHVPREVFNGRYEAAAAFLVEAGVPVEKHVLILDGIEHLTLGAGLVQAMKDPTARKRIFPNLNPATEPALAAAVGANPWDTSERLFAEAVRSFLRGAA